MKNPLHKITSIAARAINSPPVRALKVRRRSYRIVSRRERSKTGWFGTQPGGRQPRWVTDVWLDIRAANSWRRARAFLFSFAITSFR